MKNAKLFGTIGALAVVSLVLGVSLVRYKPQYTQFPIVPEVAEIPMDAAVLLSTLPPGKTIPELAKDNIFDPYRATPKEDRKPPPPPPPESIDDLVLLRGIVMLGSNRGALLELQGAALQVAAPKTTVAPGKALPPSKVKNVINPGPETSGSGHFTPSRYCGEGDKLQFPKGEAVLSRVYADSIVITYLTKDFPIILRYDWKALNARMTEFQKAAEKEQKEKDAKEKAEAARKRLDTIGPRGAFRADMTPEERDALRNEMRARMEAARASGQPPPAAIQPLGGTVAEGARGSRRGGGR